MEILTKSVQQSGQVRSGQVSPSLEIPSCRGRRRAWLSPAPPGTWFARKSSPRQKSADQKMWAACVSSFRPCQSGPGGLKYLGLVSCVGSPHSPPVNLNVIERQICTVPCFTEYPEGRDRDTEDDLLENRNLILSWLVWWCYVLSFTLFGDDTIRTISQCPIETLTKPLPPISTPLTHWPPNWDHFSGKVNN